MIKKLLAPLNNPWFLIYPFALVLAFNLIIAGENSYAYLAHAFLKGSFSFVDNPKNLSDVTHFGGKYYWTNGPFPAVLIAPFVAVFKTNFPEQLIKFPLTILNFGLIYLILKKLNLSVGKALWLAIFYIFGSSYTPLAITPFSVYLSTVIANSLLLLAIYEFLNKKRWFLIGLAIALAFLTRFPTILASIFFLPFLIKSKPDLSKLARFSLPITAAVVFFGFYNFARFGNVLETGHRYQIIPKEAAQRRDRGLFSLKHIPANLYYMLLKTPDPVLSNSTHVLKPPYLRTDYYGLSLFFLSPVLFFIFLANLKDPLVKNGLLTAFIIMTPIITHYGIGWRQVGYWHALDFFPFLLIPLVSAVKKVRLSQLVILVTLGVLITWFFTLQMLFNF